VLLLFIHGSLAAFDGNRNIVFVSKKNRNIYSSAAGLLEGEYPVFYDTDQKITCNNINIAYTEVMVDNIRYMDLSLLSVDRTSRICSLHWMVPLEDTFSSREKETLGMAMDFFVPGLNGDMNAHTLKKASDNSITGFDVTYDKKDSSGSVDGYTFTIHDDHSGAFRFWRAAAEIIITQSVGVVHYFAFKEVNMDDWKYRPTRDEMIRKITDGWYYDPNFFPTNTLAHAYAGVLYYSAARSNGFSIVESGFFTFGASLMWEYITEYKERVSANDMIFTTAGGILAGESLRMINLYIEQTFRPGIIRNTVMFIIDPFMMINRFFDCLTEDSVRVRLMFDHPVHMAAEMKNF